MSNDPYAVLRALLRAEAARSAAKPSPAPERQEPHRPKTPRTTDTPARSAPRHR